MWTSNKACKRWNPFLEYSPPVNRDRQEIHHACIARHVINRQPDVAEFPTWEQNLKSTFENQETNTWGAIFGFLWRGSLWRRGLSRRRWWSLLLLGCKMSTLISSIQGWSLQITWRESSLRLSAAVCPSWRRPWPWCCRRQWRRRWCRRRWLAPPCSAYFANCPANKEIW